MAGNAERNRESGGGRLNDQRNFSAGADDGRVDESRSHCKTWAENLLQILLNAH